MSRGLMFLLVLCAAVSVLTVFFVLIKRKRLIAGLLLSAIQGTAAVFAVKLVGSLIGVGIAVNWYTLGVGAVLGTPGVISLLLFDVIFQ